MRESQKINNLEILRGLCCLVVVVYHLLVHLNLPLIRHVSYDLYYIVVMIEDCAQKLGIYAVLGFFVISGFVITKSLAERIAPQDAFGLYLMNRFVRLAAVCAPATLAGVALSGFYRYMHPDTIAWNRYSDFSPWLIVQSMSGFSTQWNGSGWTLYYEWGFYLLVVVPFLLKRWSLKNLALAVAVLGFALWGMEYSLTKQMNVAFALGIGLMLLHKYRPHISRLTIRLLLGLSAATIALQIVTMDKTYDTAALRCVPMFGLALVALYLPDMKNRLYAVLTWLGKISFSLFIWHWPIFFFGNIYLQGDQYLQDLRLWPYDVFVLLPLAFVVAHVSYIWFEKPARVEKIPLLYRPYLWCTHGRKQRVSEQPTPW